jgi:hypothetical protein
MSDSNFDSDSLSVCKFLFCATCKLLQTMTKGEALFWEVAGKYSERYTVRINVNFLCVLSCKVLDVDLLYALML